ncbi:MAG: hypothetical protein JO297_05850 [Nitrososphaeraceae archaeon]|nr:hypothetical protein [Nitrososphaeraceae archaeon]
MVAGGIKVVSMVSTGIRVTKAIASVIYLTVLTEDKPMLSANNIDMIIPKE